MSLWGELKRRNLYKVAATYAIVAWLLVQVASVVLPTFSAPRIVMQLFVFFLFVGFPIALILAWAYELTPGGLKHDEAPSSLRGGGRVLTYSLAGIVSVTAVVIGAYLAFDPSGSETSWNRSEALLQIERFIDAGAWEAAYATAQEVVRMNPDDSDLPDLWPRFSWSTTIASEPSAARVFRKPFSATDDAWEELGISPLTDVRIPFGVSILRLEADGYQPLLRTIGGGVPGVAELVGELRDISPNVPPYALTLDTAATLPSGKVRVPGWTENIEGVPAQLPDFFLGRFEVTNREFKAFVDAGGYERREFWEHSFVQGDATISWEVAMSRFVDRTGRPGPSTWEAGDYSDGQDEFPVSGVSWYEAAAYARYVGEELPTVYHWRRAIAARATTAWTLPVSNLDSDGPARVGQYQGIDWAGTYDMSGNVREWVFNSVGDERFILGGGWSDPLFRALDYSYSQPPMDRSEINGFRLAIARDQTTVAARHAFPLSQPSAVASFKPVSDEEFERLVGRFDYAQGSLNAVIEPPASSRNWIRERISFEAGYDGERMVLYLYLPTTATPPYQTVIYWGGLEGAFLDSYDKAQVPLDFVLKSGRAVAVPILQGTFERGGGGFSASRGGAAARNQMINQVIDVRRSIDYLETRNDIDADAFGFFAASNGGVTGPIIMALETRLQVAVLYVAGFLREVPWAEVEPRTYITRVDLPVLMLNGELDSLVQIETSAKPFFQMLGTPEADKDHVIASGGHFVPREVLIRETLDWLDRYLGPVD